MTDNQPDRDAAGRFTGSARQWFGAYVRGLPVPEHDEALEEPDLLAARRALNDALRGNLGDDAA